MYDILNKMKLLEGKQAKPDFLDLDNDGNRKESMKKAAREVDEGINESDQYSIKNTKTGQTYHVSKYPITKDSEKYKKIKAAGGDHAHAAIYKNGKLVEKVEELDEAGYSAKAARAGKDIGKPGKQFAKIAKGAAERYGSKERSEKVAGAVLAKLRKEDVNEADQQRKIIKKNGKPVGEVGIDPDAPVGRPGQWYMKHYASGYNLGGYDSREEAMSELKYALSQEVNEADMEEGNDFTGARLAAIRAGKPTFKVDGKTYRVTGDTRDERKQVDEISADLLNRSMHAAYGKAADAKEKGHGQAAKIHTSQASRFKDAYATKAKAQRKQDDVDSLSMAKRRKAGLAEEDQLDEREMKDKDEFDRWAEPGDYYKSTKGRVIKTKTGVRHERDAEEEQDDDRDDDKPRGRGRPKGSKRALGAKGPTGRSKLLNRGSIKEGDKEKSFPDYKGPRDEYGDPDDGVMRDYRPHKQREEEDEKFWDRHHDDLRRGDESAIEEAIEMLERSGYVVEKAVSKAQRAAAGIAYAAKKGDIPKSELRGASKEMAKMPSGELKKFAKTKEKGLPEKKKEESVEETTTAGSVATAPAEAPKGKKGMVFGKGVYEGQIAESYEAKLQSMLAEGINFNMSMDAEGGKSLSVTATDDDAVKLAEILKLAGMGSAHGYEEACPACGQAPCGCDEQIDEELANSPDEQYSDTDTMVNTLSGGLNGPKRQINPNNMGDNPLAMRNLGKAPSGQINLGQVAENVQTETERRLMDLYRRIDR